MEGNPRTIKLRKGVRRQKKALPRTFQQGCVSKGRQGKRKQRTSQGMDREVVTILSTGFETSWEKKSPGKRCGTVSVRANGTFPNRVVALFLQGLHPEGKIRCGVYQRSENHLNQDRVGQAGSPRDTLPKLHRKKQLSVDQGLQTPKTG